jgi:hypothetical protein
MSKRKEKRRGEKDREKPDEGKQNSSSSAQLIFSQVQVAYVAMT